MKRWFGGLCDGKRENLLIGIVLIGIIAVFGVRPTEAAIIQAGNVEPAGAWTSSTTGYVGMTSVGSVVVDGGSTLLSKNAYLAVSSGVSGAATVTGLGSTWNNSGSLYVGYNGVGTLTVDDGGDVVAQTLYASLKNLLGNGAITTQGAVLDADFRFDASHGMSTPLTFGSGGTLTVNASAGILGAGYRGKGSITVTESAVVNCLGGILGHRPGSIGTALVSGTGSKWIGNYFHVGDYGDGSLRIEAGGQVNDIYGFLGDFSGTGTAIVTGSGSMWTNTGPFYVGWDGRGTLLIDNGGQVSNSSGTLGENAGSSGTVIVKGLGSKWTNNTSLNVGYDGHGMLHIEEGGEVSNFSGSIGNLENNPSMVTVSGTGSKWTNSGELIINGVLQIEKGGQVGSNGGKISFSPSSTGLVTVTDAGSTWTNSSSLVIGTSSAGTLLIQAGGQVISASGKLGAGTYSSGTVIVMDTNSKWINSGTLSVGDFGNGRLRIEAGGQVTNTIGYIGKSSGYSGIVTVKGNNSNWTNNGSLSIGGNGSGTVHIRSGGAVTSSLVSVNPTSFLTIDVGIGSNLRIGSSGTGTITNSGKVRVLAAPQQAAGSTWLPIVAGTWSGNGTYQAVGGTWNATSHVFTVSETLGGVSGTALNVDLAQKQRVLITESVKNWSLGASFLAKTGTGNTFDFTATAVAGSNLTVMEGLLQPGEVVSSGWAYSASGSGYATNDPMYLSLSIASNLVNNNVQLWQLNSGTWSKVSVDDFFAKNGYASFTVTTASGTYAVSGLASSGWNVDADGSWQSGTKWTTSPIAPGGVNVAAVLGTAITAPRSVSVDSALTLGVLTMNSAQHYTLAGTNALTMQVNSGYSAKIDVQNSDTMGHVIETPVVMASPLEIAVAADAKLTLSGELQTAGKTLTVSGGGELVVSQGISTSGTIAVTGGTLRTPSLVADTLTIGGTESSRSAATAVPEPSGVILILLALGCGAIGVARQHT